MGKGRPVELPTEYLDVEVLSLLSEEELKNYMRPFPKFTPAAAKQFNQELKAARARHAAAAAIQAVAAVTPPAASTVQRSPAPAPVQPAPAPEEQPAPVQPAPAPVQPAPGPEEQPAPELGEDDDFAFVPLDLGKDD